MKTKGQKSFVFHLLIGICGAIVSGSILVAIGSKLIITQRIGEGSIGLLAATILLLSSVFGNIISTTIHGDGILKTSAFHAFGLLCTVVVGALIIDGQFNNVLVPVLSILGGGIIGCVICMKKSGIRSKRKSRYR